MFTLLVILAVFLQVAIALGVYFRRKGGHANVIFMLLSLSLASWAFIDYIAIAIHQGSHTVYAIRTVISFVVIQNTLFYFFASSFPDKRFKELSHRRLLIVYSSAVLLLTQSPFLFKSVTIKNGTANPNPTPFIIFFVIHAVITIAPGLRTLFVKYRNALGLQKRQLLFILFASTILWLIVPITNFAITLSAKTTIFVKLSPFYTLAFGALITYAIIAQKLFDIKAAVARSMAYLLIVATMTLVYGTILFGVVDVLFKGANHEFQRQVLSIILITPLALVFQRTKQFFDRITNRLFYRDIYVTQDILDSIGNIAVSEIDLYQMLKDTRKVLRDALKSSFIEFVLFKADKPYIEAHTHKTIPQNILSLGAHIKDQHRDLLVTDELERHIQLHQEFIDAGVALSLQLKTKEQIVGYIIFGAKKSGDIYSSQDKKLLVIVANELAIAIQNALRFEEIQNFNLTLQAKVEEATRKLRRANEKLKALDETKDDFISMASHQLRTPLTSVKGYISMVLEQDAGKITHMQREMLGQAFFSSQRMVYLIADLLNISRLKTGKFIIESVKVNLAEVVEQELSQLQETAASRSVKLIYAKPKTFPDLMLDETKTRQVIMNFVDNAIYYTPTNGHITVRLVNNLTTVELRVEDDGIGVPKSEQPHLFTKFYRAGNARKARPDGTGLGLFMAKKVVIAQGGALIFESQEGKGSTFGFVFSKSRLAVSSADHTVKS